MEVSAADAFIPRPPEMERIVALNRRPFPGALNVPVSESGFATKVGSC